MPSYSLVAKSGLCLALLLTLFSIGRAQAPATVAPPQLQFMEGHTAPVYAVATSPDGTTLLSASIDGTIRAWDRATNQPIRLMGKHLPGVVSLAVAPNGLHVAAGGLDHKVHVYDLPSNYPRAIVPTVPNTGARIDVLADGTAALTGDISRTIRLWSLATNAPLRDFAGTTGDVTSVLVVSAYEQPPAPVPPPAAPAAAGAEVKVEAKEPVELPPPVLKPKYAIAAAKDGTLRAWDINTAAPVSVVYSAQQNALAASREGDLLVGAGEDGLLREFRWPLPAPVSLAGHADQVTGVAISDDGKLLVTGSLDLKVNVYKSADGVLLHALAGQTGKTTSVAINANNSLVAAGSDLGTIKFWAVEDAADKLMLAGHLGAVSRLAFPAKGNQIASAGADGTVRIWNPPVAPRPVPGHAAALTVVAASPDGKTGFSAGADKLARLWTVATGEEIRAIKDLPQPIVAATFSKDGKQLALGDAVGAITLQNSATGASLGSLVAHAGAVTGIAIDAENKRMVSSGVDGTVKLWSLPLTASKAIVEGEQPVTGLAISSDAKFLVTGTVDGKLQLLDTVTGKPLQKLAGETGAITNLTLSADNKLLAVANAAGVVQFWNTEDGSALGSIAGHVGAVNGVAFHAKDPLLATAGEDMTVRVWQMPVAPKPVVKLEKSVGAIALSPDGAVGVIAGGDGKAALIKLADGKPVSPLAGGEVAVVSATFKKDGTSLATGDETGTIRLYAPADGASQGVIAGHDGPVTSIAYNPIATQPLLATTGADGTVKVWQLPISPGSVLPVSKAAVTAVAVSADGALTLIASDDQSARVFDANGTQMAIIEKLPANATAAAFSADAKQLLLALANGIIQVHNATDGVFISTLAGQPGGVTAMAVNSKAPQLATASKEGSLRVWNIPAEVKPLGNHTGVITGVSVSPNGLLVATASADKSVRVWTLADGAEKWALGHTGAVTALAWKADSSQLATGDGKSIRLWNIADGAQAGTFGEHAAPVTGVAFSADNLSLISSSADKTVKVWKLAPATDEEKKPVTLEGHTGSITALAVVGPTVVTGSEDATVRTWNLAEAKAGIEIKAGGPVISLAVSPDQKFVAVGGKDQSVKLFNLADGAAGPVLTGLAGAVADIAISGDNLRVAATSAEGDIRVWGATGELLDVLVAGGAKGTVLAFAPDSKGLIVGSSDNKIRVLAPALVKEIKVGDKPVTALAYLPDGASILTGSADKAVKLWTLADGKSVRDFAGADAVTALAVSVDGTKVFGASADKAVRVWNTADAALQTTLTHPTVVNALSPSADNLKLATGSADGQVRVWQIASGRLLQRFAAHAKAVSGLAFYPDNKTVVSGSADQTVVKSVVAATLMLAAHEGGAFGVTFTADGTQLISAGADKLVKQVDLVGNAVKQFAGAEGAIRSLALKPDGLQLAAGSDDKHVHFWTVASGAVERKVLTPAGVGAIAYNADGTRLVANGADKHLRIVQTLDGRILEDQTLAADPTAAAFLPDGKTVLVGDSAGSAAIHTLTLVRVLAGHTAPVQHVAFTPVGAFLLSGGTDKSLIQWNLADGANMRAMAHTDVITGLAISPDAAFAWTTSADKNLRQWTLSNGVATWAVPLDQPLRSLSVSPDGTRAAVGADDNSVRVFDLATQRELQRFAGHAGIPSRLALAADKKTLLSGGVDKNVWQWNIAAERVIVGDVGKVNAVALLPDGSQILSAGDDHITKLWDLEGKLVRQFGGNPTAVRTMAVRPDGLQVALGGDPASAQVNAYLFNIADAVLQQTIATPAGIHTITYSADGKVAISGADNHIRVYNSTNGKLLQDLTSPVAPGSIAFATDSSLLAAAADNQAYVFTYSLAKMLVAHESPVTGLAYTPDGKQVVTSGLDKTVKLWDLATGTVAATFTTVDQPVNDLALSSDGKILAAACADSNVRVWGVPTDAAAKPAEEPAAGAAPAAPVAPPAIAAARTMLQPAVVTAVGLNADGTRLAVGTNDAFVHLWDLKLNKELERLAGNTTTINAVKVTADGSMVLSGGVDKTAWRWMSGVKQAVVASETALSSVTAKPDGSQVFTAGISGAVQGWEANSLAPSLKFEGMPAGPTFVAASSDGKYLAGAGTDGTAQLWSTADGKNVASVKTPVPAIDVALGDAGHKLIVAGNDMIARSYGLQEVEGKPATLELNQQALGATLALTDLALSSDDHTLVVVSDDRNIRRYHAASAAPIHEFEAHEKAVYGLAYSADGTRLATAGGDHTVGVWDTKTWELVTRCEGHTKQVQGVSFAPAGTTLASAALDGTVRVWSLTANLPGDRPEIKNRPKSEEASLVAASPLQPVRPREPGLIAERFATNNLTGVAEISIDKQIDFDWADKKPEPFSVRWQGFITAPFTGEVTFTAEADDGMRLYVAGAAVIDGIALNGPREGKFKMTAGDRLPIQVQYFQTAEKALMKLNWSWEGQQKVLIPAEAFEHQPIYIGDQISQFSEGMVGGLMTIKYSNDGSTLVTGGTGKELYFWTMGDGKLHRKGQGHNETVYSLAFNPAGNRVASVDYSGNVFYWEFASAVPMYHQQLPAWAGYSVVVTMDGTELVVGTQDPRVMRATIPAPIR